MGREKREGKWAGGMKNVRKGRERLKLTLRKWKRQGENGDSYREEKQ